MDLRSIQRPFKEQYRSDPDSARITLRAQGSQTTTPIACSVDLGRAIYQAEAHSGVGGTGTAACSGDLLLGALAACAQLTCQMVATAMGIPTERIEVEVHWVYPRRCPSVLSRSVSALRLMRPRQPRSSCKGCVRRQNAFVWSCRR